MDISKEQKNQEKLSRKKKDSQEEEKEKTDQEKKDEAAEREVDENIRIHTMPRKYKTTSPNAGHKQSKIVGVIIISVGFLIMAGLIVGAYFFLIKPQPSTDEPIVVKNTEAPVKTEEKTPVVEKKIQEEEEKPATEEKKEGDLIFIEEELVEESATSTEEEATSTEESATSTEEVSEEEAILTVASDSDNDGLFDKEEAILGSDLTSVDSDKDGYDDLAEVLGLYNPVNTDKLYANPGINKYNNEYLKYSLLYPKAWRMSVVGDNDSVVFAVGDGSFINLIAQPNTDGSDIASWLKSLLPKADIESDDIVSKDGWSGVFHENKRIFYLTDNEKKNVFIFDYSPAKEDSLDYYNIFQVMINSFEIEN